MDFMNYMGGDMDGKNTSKLDDDLMRSFKAMNQDPQYNQMYGKKPLQPNSNPSASSKSVTTPVTTSVTQCPLKFTLSEFYLGKTKKIKITRLRKNVQSSKWESESKTLYVFISGHIVFLVYSRFIIQPCLQ